MKAAILQKIGAPLKVADIDLPKKLERGQVLVKVLCTGICGSQIQEIDGLKGFPPPHLLGHEAAGIVKEIGSDVTTVNVGDKVVCHWRKGAGIESAYPTSIFEGKEITSGPITTFSEYSIVSENRVTAIPSDIPNDYAALLGCALSTALAIIENEAQPKPNETVMIIGCGGLGLALILAAKLKGARVYATDIRNHKRGLVRKLGAEFVYGVHSADVIIDTIGQRQVLGGKYISLQYNGTTGGGFEPAKDIPHYIDMMPELNGWRSLITHRISLDAINEGIQLMRDGKAGRIMIEF